jgi:hypothetical protein
MWENCVLLNTRDSFKVTLKSVNESTSSFNFTLGDVFPDVDISNACCRQEVSIISEDEHVQDLFVGVCQIFVLADEASLIAELINRDKLVVLMVVPRDN